MFQFAICWPINTNKGGAFDVRIRPSCQSSRGCDSFTADIFLYYNCIAVEWSKMKETKKEVANSFD